MEDEKVMQLAEYLRKSHLAASVEEAVETATRILRGEKSAEKPETKEVNAQEEQKTLVSAEERNSPSYEVKKETKSLKELMEEEKRKESR